MRARVATWETHDVVLGVELAHQFEAIAFVHPSGHLTAVKTEGNRATQCKHVVLTEEVVRRSVGHFNGALLNGIHYTKRWCDFASCVHRNFKLATGHVFNSFGKNISCTVNGVQGFGEARAQAPANGGLSVNGGRSACGQNASNTCIFNDGTTVHELTPKN